MKKELVTTISSLIALLFVGLVSGAVVINEFVVDPQTDWDNSSTIGSSDEFFELYNNGNLDVNITGWNLSLIDSTNESVILSGIISEKGYFTILNPAGSQNNNGKIVLFNDTNGIVDMVSYGTYDDGNISDNAPTGNSNNVTDECLARIPNGNDTNIDSNDFLKITCTFNNTNNFVIVNNKSIVICAFENQNVTLSADVNGTNIDEVIFSYTINGTNFNKTGSKTLGSLSGYEYVIDNNQLVNGNVSWNVYVNDSFGNVFINGVKNFYVRNNTRLVVTPSSPDGLNGWYVTEPSFSLVKDIFGLRSYYRWDSAVDLLFSIAFGLEDIPNIPKESAGILELNYFSEFNCEDGTVLNETNLNQVFQIDLVSPVIKNFVPADGSIVFNNARPTIQVLLDEIYGSNSGVNNGSVYMRLDGNSSNLSIDVIDSGDVDALVVHNPPDDLVEGPHTVMVYVEDIAGRANMTNWTFEINISTSDFDLNVNMPENASYNSRRVQFNVSTTKVVDLIEYINYDDMKPRWRRLCRNCEEFGFSKKRVKSLKEGNNNITIRAVNGFGNNKSENILLFVDGKKPRISRVLPKRNSFTNGSGFFVKFVEDNLEDVKVSFNPTKSVNLSACVDSGRSATECSIDLNLSDFDGQFIEYSFNVSDSINEVMSKVTRVFVDVTSPILTINMPENISYERRIPFNLTVSEKSKVEFYDNLDTRPRWRRLCSNCDEYGVDRIKRKSFREGSHDVLIRAVDKAGNSDVERIVFNVLI